MPRTIIKNDYYRKNIFKKLPFSISTFPTLVFPIMAVFEGYGSNVSYNGINSAPVTNGCYKDNDPCNSQNCHYMKHQCS